jgi:hypothetical protein
MRDVLLTVRVVSDLTQSELRAILEHLDKMVREAQELSADINRQLDHIARANQSAGSAAAKPQGRVERRHNTTDRRRMVRKDRRKDLSDG